MNRLAPVNDVDRSPAPKLPEGGYGEIGFNRVNGANFDGEKVFSSMRSASERAREQFPESVHESDYMFGGHRVHVRVVGSELARHILEPFCHLKINPTSSNPSQLLIDLWDEKATGIRCYRGRRHRGPGWSEATSRSADGRFIGQALPHTLVCFDRSSAYIVGSIGWHDRIFIYERAKPLARLLLEWYRDRQMQVIHAGLVAKNGQGILFAGKSGAGKSTVALACVFGGFNYLAEDFVGLQGRADGSFVGHSVYNSVFLNTGHLERFAELAPAAIRGRPPYEKKSAVLLSRLFPDRLERAVPIQALVLPQVASSPEAKLLPASRVDALLALGPSSLLQIPNNGLGVRGFNTLARLVERIPCYRLEVGSDLASIAHRVDRILTKLDPA